MKTANTANKTLVASEPPPDNPSPLTYQAVRQIVLDELAKNNPKNNAAPLEEIIGMTEVVRRLPLSPRSVRTAVQDGLLPSIRLKGGRKLLFRWSSVVEALARLERRAE